MGIPETLADVCKRNDWRCEGGQIELSIEGGRSQRVAVEPFNQGDNEMIRLYSGVGDAAALSQTRLEAALRINFGLAYGALAIRENELVMVDTFLLKDADADELESSVRFLAETADRYERLIYSKDSN